MSKITVAMSSYNHEKYVGAAIESVLSQSFSDFEFIIVDDGSSDKTVQEILKFKDPRLVFIHLDKNVGASLALSKAIQAGTADYVAILNSDDCFLPGKLEKQFQFLEQNPSIGAVFGAPQFVDDSGIPFSSETFYSNIFKLENRSRFEWLNHLFYHQNVFCHPTVLIRRDCYKKIGYYEPRFAQVPDLDFWIRLLFHYEIHVLPEELTQFRILADMSNVSAPLQENSYRGHWELTHVLKHYLKISSLEDYHKIFPEDKADFKELIPFYVANLALKIPNPEKSFYRYFALETLFSLFEDETSKQLLAKLGYTESEFLRNKRFFPVLHQYIPPPPPPPPFLIRLKNYFFRELWPTILKTS